MRLNYFTVGLFAATAQAVALTAGSQIDAQLLACEAVTGKPDPTSTAETHSETTSETASTTDVAFDLFPKPVNQAAKAWAECTGLILNGAKMGAEVTG